MGYSPPFACAGYKTNSCDYNSYLYPCQADLPVSMPALPKLHCLSECRERRQLTLFVHTCEIKPTKGIQAK